ncbi:DUF262 domain-containing protein [Sorangium sp. So ce513]|uniref:DUF262 domain-containing protein n=1 Tax=Sorangium sp. So ce513 TaxID=3133315 RepID=UPI003F5D57DF
MATTRPAEPPPQLDRRPEAKAFQIDELLPRVREGKIRIPRFQRGLKWEDSDRLDFFDSIYRGYPVGTLLFWQRQAPAARLSLGKLNLDAPARSDALWVVDGQQRITTLAEALLVPPASGERAIYFDLAGVKFVYAKVHEESSANGREEAEIDRVPRLPLAVVLDSTQLLEWLFAHPKLDPAQRALALDVGKRIRATPGRSPRAPRRRRPCATATPRGSSRCARRLSRGPSSITSSGRASGAQATAHPWPP